MRLSKNSALGIAVVLSAVFFTFQSGTPAQAGRDAFKVIKEQLEQRARQLQQRGGRSGQDWFEDNNWQQRRNTHQQNVNRREPSGTSRWYDGTGRVPNGSIAAQIRHEINRVKGWPGAQKTLTAFYEARNYQPVWISGSRLSRGAIDIIRHLSRSMRDGLDPDAYLVPDPRMSFTSVAIIARADVVLSRTIVQYARDASGGRVHPSEISASISLKPVFPNAARVLNAVARSPDPAGVLAGYHPTHRGYLALREQLNRRLSTGAAQVASVAPVIRPGKAMRLGVVDPRVAQLRQRLGLRSNVANPSYFGEDVHDAVLRYQEDNQLTIDGIVGRGTLRRLNGKTGRKPRASIADIIANMEAWRWMPRELGSFHVAVNVPEFRVRVMDQGSTRYSTRVVVGKKSHKTPVFSDAMEYVAVNPTWNVPKSITLNEIIPELLKDASYLKRSRLEVVRGYGSNTVRVDPAEIVWSDVTEDNINFRLREPPNERNALGKIKFMFPNKHAVYLHDTPAKNLFGRNSRAYSHGCVRVQNPMDFAGALLAYDRKVSPEKIRQSIGKNEKNLYLSEKIPVHLGYFTVRVSDSGKLQKFPDIYGHHAKLKRALGL